MSYCSFLSKIFSLIIVIKFYVLSERFFLKHEGLLGARVASSNKKEYFFLYKFIDFLKSLSGKRLNAVCGSSCLFGIFLTEKFVQFSLIFFRTGKYVIVIKTKEMA